MSLPSTRTLFPTRQGQPDWALHRCKPLPPSPLFDDGHQDPHLSSASTPTSISFRRPYSNQRNLHRFHSRVSYSSFDSPSPYSTTGFPRIVPSNPTQPHYARRDPLQLSTTPPDGISLKTCSFLKDPPTLISECLFPPVWVKAFMRNRSGLTTFTKRTHHPQPNIPALK